MSEVRDPNEVSTGPYEPGDEVGIQEGFREVFDIERPMESWRWGFLDNPGGTHVWLGKTASGEVASQYATLPRRVRFLGKGPARFGEAVDSFVRPAWRQGLKREGLFSRTFHDFIARRGSLEHEVVTYGFPIPVAYRIGKKLMGYGHLHHVDLHAKVLDAQDADAGTDLGDGCTVTPVARFGEDEQAVFDGLSDRYVIVALRDAAYLNWRYLDRPGVPYECFAFREANGRPFALVVLRHRWRDQAETAVAELLAPVEHPKMPDVVRWIERHCAAAGSERVLAMFRPECPESIGLAHLGWGLERSDFRWVARTHDEDYVTLEELGEHWWATLGDFDVV